MNRPRLGSSGFMLIMSVVILLLVMIFVPTLVKLSQEDVRWSTRRIHLDEQYSVGEAALDRGSWKLGESESVWRQAIAGTPPIAQYDYDQSWTDLDPRYRYKIKISSGPGPQQVTVRAKVRSEGSPGVVRVFEGIFTRNFVDALVMKADMFSGSDRWPRVHWGPIKAYDQLNIAITSASVRSEMPRYPRKYARRGIGPASPETNFRDTIADEQNSDRLEFWAFDRNIGEPPAIDLDYYRDRANRSSVPRTTAAGGRLYMRGDTIPAVSTGSASSAYFICSENLAAGDRGIRFTTTGGAARYEFINSTTVVFIENRDPGNCRNFLQEEIFLKLEALIVAGKDPGSSNNNHLRIQAKATTLFAATIPVNANLEYAHSGAALAWAANGGPAWTGGTRYPFNISNVVFHGFIYVQDGELDVDLGSFDNDVRVVGAVYVRELETDMIKPGRSRYFDIYMDDDVVKNLKVVYAPIRRRIYRELKTDLVW